MGLRLGVKSLVVWVLLSALGLLLSRTYYVDAAEPPLRVITYNLWGLPDPILQKPARFQPIVQLIPSANADIIGFQEAFNHRAKPLAKLPQYPYRAWGPGKGLHLTHSGLLILSRYPMVKTARVAYGVCAGWDCLANKGAVYARIRVPGMGDVDVFNTHLNADGHVKIRIAQMKKLVAFIQAQHDPARPLILMGDLNSELEQEEYRYIQKSLELTDLYESYVNATPGLSTIIRNGYTSDATRNPNLPSSQYPKRLDYVFFHEAEQSRITHAADRVAQARLAFDHKVGNLMLSDHFAVLIDIVKNPTGDETKPNPVATNP